MKQVLSLSLCPLCVWSEGPWWA